MISRIVAFAFVAPMLMLPASHALAQTPPFFGGGVVAYDPEIRIINSGAITDVQVVVTEDRRYVTINMQSTQSRLIDLNVFQVAQAQQARAAGSANGSSGGNQVQGFVGQAGFLDEDEMNPSGTRVPPASKADVAGGRGRQPSHVKTSPGEILKNNDPSAINSPLRKRGMFLLTTAVKQQG